jgi:hypothetical protein
VLVAVIFLIETEARLPVSAMVARFVDRLASLSAAEWEAIQRAITNGEVEVTMLEASRNAAVALAVRDLISRDQFDHLYRPFLLVITLESLEAPLELD